MNEYAYNQLLSLLQHAASLAEENIPNVNNFDLESLSQALDSFVQELGDLGAFEGDSIEDEDEFED